MRTVIGGDGSDTTAATQAYLQQTVNPLVRDLILIGPKENPNSIWLTNHESPLLYSPYGTFKPAVVSRDKVTTKIGLESSSMAITWTPSNQTAGNSSANLSPFQRAQAHFYDNWPVIVLRCFMPTPGDANTLGCTVWWGGRVHTCKQKRNRLVFNCKDYLDTLSQKVPSAVVEITNTLASAAAATLPSSPAGLPVFGCHAQSSEDYIVADCLSPTAGNIYAGDIFNAGYMVFLDGPGATLAGYWSAIGQNGKFTDGDGNSWSEFQIYQALPWAPTPYADGSGDTFYVSMKSPVTTPAAWAANTAYALNAQILDPAAHLQVATTAGTSGATIPTFNDSGGTTEDGTVVWTDQGTNPGPSQSGFPYVPAPQQAA